MAGRANGSAGRSRHSHRNPSYSDDDDDFEVATERRYLPKNNGHVSSSSSKTSSHNNKTTARPLAYSPPPARSQRLATTPSATATPIAASPAPLPHSYSAILARSPPPAATNRSTSHLNASPSLSYALRHSASSSPVVSSQPSSYHSLSSSPTLQPLTLSNPNPSASQRDVMSLSEMFPYLDMDSIAAVYRDVNGDQARVAEILLSYNTSDNLNAVGDDTFAQLDKTTGVISEINGIALEDVLPTPASAYSSPSPQPPMLAAEHHAAPPARSRGNSNISAVGTQEDYLTHLSEDSLLHLISFLDLYDIAVCTRISRELYPHFRAANQRVTSLSFSNPRYQKWSGQRMLEMIASFPAISSLSLRQCPQFTDWHLLPHALFGTRVTDLTLSNNNTITDDDIMQLMPLGRKLQRLDLSHCSMLTDETLEALTLNCSKLSELSLQGIKTVSVRSILRLCQQLTTLKKLDCRRTPATVELLNGVLKSDLEHLNVSLVNKFSTVNVQAPGRASSRLRTLILSAAPNLKQASLDIASLQTLIMSECRQLQQLTIDCQQLQTLNLTGCIALTDVTQVGSRSADANTRAIQRPSSITHLYLAQCRSLTTSSFLSLIDMQAATLTTLDACGLLGITDDVLQRITEKCHLLQSIDVSGCRNCTAEAIQSIHLHVKAIRDSAAAATKVQAK